MHAACLPMCLSCLWNEHSPLFLVNMIYIIFQFLRYHTYLLGRPYINSQLFYATPHISWKFTFLSIWSFIISWNFLSHFHSLARPRQVFIIELDYHAFRHYQRQCTQKLLCILFSVNHFFVENGLCLHISLWTYKNSLNKTIN